MKMDAVQTLNYALGFSFELLDQLVKDLTQDQADWLPPGTANSIGALYWHAVAYADQYVHDFCMAPFKDIPFAEWWATRAAGQDPGTGQVALRHRDGWQDKVVIAWQPENPQDPYWQVRASREGLQVDLQALHGYARAVSQTLTDWLASLTPEDLGRTISTPIGELKMGQVLESFIIGHISWHNGEISALRGCQGLQGYPW
jgi:hypothetical protein